MILVVDAHVDEESAGEFFALLERVAATCEDVVFLGDIFELWIALPGHESDLHRRFASWCVEQKPLRKIGFVEGNHEFFVHEERAELFTWSTRSSWLDEQHCLFAHGDLINRRDLGYRAYRFATRNRTTKQLLRRLSSGPRLALCIRRRLKVRNAARVPSFPQGMLERYAERCFRDGVRAVLAGHFHREFEYRPATGGVLYLLPAWCTTRRVVFFDSCDGSLADWPGAEGRHTPVDLCGAGGIRTA